MLIKRALASFSYDTTQFDLVSGKLHLMHFHVEDTQRTCVGVNTEDGSGEYDTLVGYNAGHLSTGGYNVLIGNQAGENITTGLANTVVGTWSLQNNLTSNFNTALGYYSLVTCVGATNTAVGAFSCSLLTTGFENVGVGYYALQRVAQGYYNMALGSGALRNMAPPQRVITAFADLGGGQTQVTTSTSHSLTTGDYVYISGTTHYDGWYTLVSGSGTTFVITKAFAGDDAAGYVIKDTEASKNVAVGSGAGRDCGTGGHNVFIGFQAGCLANNLVKCVYIGYQAGFNIDRSYTLAIDISDTADPLIYGEFDNRLVLINGDFTVTEQCTASYFESVVVTGTQPYACTSTTLNTNLNADLWDGYHAFMGDTEEPTGFTSTGYAATTLSFVDATRVFTITGDHDVWIEGVKYSKSTDDITIDDSTGLHFVYYDSSGVLSQSTTFPGWNSCTIAFIYYNTTTDKGIIGNERHGIVMDSATHTYLHETVGTRFESGFATSFTDTTFSSDAGIIWDEDLEHDIDAQTNCYVFYKNGSADYEWDGPGSLYYKLNGATLRYNNGNNLADVPVANYVAYWMFATNDPDTPITFLMGQRVDVTLANARSNNTYTSLSFGVLPYKEMKLLFRVLLQNLGGTATYIETQDYRSVSNLPAGTYVATSHSTLTGLNWASAGHTFDTNLNLGSYGLITGSITASSGNLSLSATSGYVYLASDILTDRWLSYVGNLFLGIGAAGAGTLENTFGPEGYENTGLGYNTLYNITTGSFNMAVGTSSLYNLLTGSYNVGLGRRSLYTLTYANYNTGIGAETLYSLTTGNYNTAIGYQCLYSNVTGTTNVGIGPQAGYSCIGSGNVFVGYQAGYSETGSNTLYISNSNTVDPLIYGEFDNGLVVINGDLSITEQCTASYYYSDVEQGTSPYSCVSTTLNVNLNADLWDGQHLPTVESASSGMYLTNDGSTLSWVDINYENPLTFDYPLSRTGNVVSFGYNTTNLQLTSNQLNTIQDIATTSTPQFSLLGVGIAAQTGTQTAGIYCYSTSNAAPLSLIGVNVAVNSTRGGGNQFNLYGLNFQAFYTPTGATANRACTTMVGCRGTVTCTNESGSSYNSTVTTAYGMLGGVSSEKPLSGTGAVTVTTAYAYYAASCAVVNGATIGTSYAFFDAGQIGASTNWGLGINTANSYISGSLSIGKNTAPTQALDVVGSIEASVGYRCGGTAPVADGTYTVGAPLTGGGSNGTITTKGGIITAVTQAT
jgi:hypothetical protein